MHNKLAELKRILQECGRVTVAFSSGTDSTFLLKVAIDTLGTENVLAVTMASCFMPEREIKEAKEFCESQGINHEIIEVDVLSIPEISSNPADRCYYCKKNIFSRIIDLSSKHNISTVLEGANADDTSDYRPGMRAVKELCVKSPLLEAGLTKSEIRAMAKELSLYNYNKPSAACLASRISYGDRITAEKLKMVEKAEEYLAEAGFSKYRVRLHEINQDSCYIARIELSLKEDMELLISLMKQENSDTSDNARVFKKIKELGFAYVTLDMFGYRMGSMNEIL